MNTTVQCIVMVVQCARSSLARRRNWYLEEIWIVLEKVLYEH
jgi:hypothetical protein